MEGKEKLALSCRAQEAWGLSSPDGQRCSPQNSCSLPFLLWVFENMMEQEEKWLKGLRTRDEISADLNKVLE